MVTNREQLIARKHTVQQQLKQAQQRLDVARHQWDEQMAAPVESSGGWVALFGRWLRRGVRGPRSQQTRIVQLQQQVDSLMAEEYRLRCAIDRNGD